MTKPLMKKDFEVTNYREIKRILDALIWDKVEIKK